MNAHTYPGRGLSLSQLIFALNEELKRVAYSPLSTLEEVSQLDQGASHALATIREWRNSFIPVNRIPIDILSLIPTHLPCQKVHFRVASVCRHWRRVFLKHGALWSQLFLGKGEEYVSTLLERAKGSALDIISYRDIPSSTIALISPRAQQIRNLKLKYCPWQDIITFSEFDLSLRTLQIISPLIARSHGQPGVVTPPSSTFFKSSVDLEAFVFHCHDRPSLLGHFVFPNITTFELSSEPLAVEYSASYLLDFLEASPMLQTVDVKISAPLTPWNVPEEMVVVLPNAETFSLRVTNDPAAQVYNIAAHISCPRARSTLLTYQMFEDDMNNGLVLFPTPAFWSTIVPRSMASPIEEVTLEIKRSSMDDLESFLTFQSPDATIYRLGLNIIETDATADELTMPRVEMGWEVLCQALTTIQNHPLLSHVKRLRIEFEAAVPNTYYEMRTAQTIRKLFSSLGPLDGLTISGCDLCVFLPHFFDGPWLNDLEKPIVFLHTKELTILHPPMEDNEVECVSAVMGLAKLQHALAIPFERLTVRMGWLPVQIEEELKRWVGTVDCREEEYVEEDDM
ncbi:hypothetical protein BJ322DRAFT_884870 [Thelephora terrestris]|uniref:F-box domain-containing protein n=1 Tax=Thelephora terrestris TaxID=56493 RepID=A0A9P6L635_9AGAM|nr:hypothetical protein BJ322DRAFT_884870 [Thelephora terrestris]